MNQDLQLLDVIDQYQANGEQSFIDWLNKVIAYLDIYYSAQSSSEFCRCMPNKA